MAASRDCAMYLLENRRIQRPRSTSDDALPTFWAGTYLGVAGSKWVSGLELARFRRLRMEASRSEFLVER